PLVPIDAPRPADHEAQVAPLHPPFPEEAAELHRVELLAVRRQQAHVRVAWNPPVHPLLLPHLDQLETRVTGQQLLVVLDVVGVRWLRPPDGYDGGSHQGVVASPAERITAILAP